MLAQAAHFCRCVMDDLQVNKADQLRTIIRYETKRGDLWRDRAMAAEKWWIEAAPLLAEIGRKYQLGEAHVRQIRALMSWEPDVVGQIASESPQPVAQVRS